MAFKVESASGLAAGCSLQPAADCWLRADRSSALKFIHKAAAAAAAAAATTRVESAASNKDSFGAEVGCSRASGTAQTGRPSCSGAAAAAAADRSAKRASDKCDSLAAAGSGGGGKVYLKTG